MRQYDLSCYLREYEALTRVLGEMAFSHQETDERGWQNFVMPKGTVKISIKDDRPSRSEGKELRGRVLMAVRRTTFREPKYVKEIVQRLGGKSSGGGSYTNEGLVDLYLSESQ